MKQIVSIKTVFKIWKAMIALLFVALLAAIISMVSAKDSNPYGELILFEATAYCYGNLTKTETVPVAGRSIAVDPKVIPLGSTVIVYTEDMELLGIYQAEDTGRLVKGRIIDIYMEDNGTCLEWGRRPVYAQVVDAEG